mmetsp:Transcript_146566/g.365486  ORF Transcript_146566/g.365486 Transcript_146566/m.365486 type:complete len:180 (-) Transcript_146566:267-806(-)
MFCCCAKDDSTSKEIDRVPTSPVMDSSGARQGDQRPKAGQYEDVEAYQDSVAAPMAYQEQPGGAKEPEPPGGAAPALEATGPQSPPEAQGLVSGDFSIQVSKKPGSSGKIGLDVCRTDGVLKIKKVTEGLIMDWNLANPEMAVREGDCVTEVNGSYGNPDMILAVIAKESDLNIKVHRP